MAAPDRRTDRAFAAFRQAFETGDTTAFAALADPELSFMAPLPFPAWKDEQHGLDRFAEMVAFERDEVRLRVRLTPLATFEDGDRGLVIFRPDGTLGGAAYTNELAVLFEFRGERVRRFKEYVGTVVRPAA